MTKKPKKKKVGRPTKYDPIYAEKLIEFFDIDPVEYKDITITYKDGSTKDISQEEAAPIPFLTDFCKTIGITEDTIVNWTKKYPEFLGAYKRAKKLQVQFIMTNALRMNFSAVFSIFTLKNIARWQDSDEGNWRDKQDIEHSGSVNWTELVKSASNSTDKKTD